MDGLRPIIYLVGIGIGEEDQLTNRAMDYLETAQVVMGADRMLDSVSTYTDKKRVSSTYKPGGMIQRPGSFRWGKVALVLLGDTGPYSGAKAATKTFVREEWNMKSVSGMSSLSYFCVGLGKSRQNVHPTSNRGWDYDVVAHTHGSGDCFILLGGAGSVPDLYCQLVSSGVSNVTIWAGENFSYEDECIAWEMTPAELLMGDERPPSGSLVCILVENIEAVEGQLYLQPGPGDDDYVRGQVPMIKREVRRISLEKLYIGAQAVCYDTGAGTGSVAVEIGMEIRKRGGSGQVYAVERSRKALQLIESSCQKLHEGWMGLHIVEGEAPGAMEGLEPPARAFINGSNGHMYETMAALLSTSPHVRTVANATTLKIVGETLTCVREFKFATGEITQIWVALVDTVGGYHMPRARSPVYVAVMQDPKDDEGEIQ